MKKISDSHTDILTEIKSKTKRENYFAQIKDYVQTISCAVFTTNKKIDVTKIGKLKKEIEEYNNKYNLNLILSIEDLGFIKSEKEIEELIKIKPISTTLTWNEANQFAGGSLSKNGLTQMGFKTIQLLEENNILIDTAHLSRKAFHEFSKISKFPIYNSHSNINSIFKHKRNLTDKQIKKIVDSNGFMGLTVYQHFIANNKISCRDIALQFDYLIKKYGHKNFGIGSDLFGIEKEFLPTDFSGYTKVDNLVLEFKKLNYSQEIIDAILFKNFQDFLLRIKKKNTT